MSAVCFDRNGRDRTYVTAFSCFSFQQCKVFIHRRSAQDAHPCQFADVHCPRRRSDAAKQAKMSMAQYIIQAINEYAGIQLLSPADGQNANDKGAGHKTPQA